MAGAGYQVKGAKELRAHLKRAGISVQDLKDAHAEVARIVEERAEPRIHSQSGRLRRSTRSSGTKTAAIVRVGGARVRYAGVNHFGWPARHYPANPFILDARDETQDRWEDKYLAALETVIEAIEGKPGL